MLSHHRQTILTFIEKLNMPTPDVTDTKMTILQYNKKSYSENVINNAKNTK